MERKFFKLLLCAASFLFLMMCSMVCAKETHYLSVGTMFKNEAKWLSEWIEFHRLVGVNHFYLYNNQSSDDYLNVLQPYIDRKLVTLIDFDRAITNPTEFSLFQREAMEHCLALADSTWLAIIDVDEFLFPGVENDLKPILQHFDQIPDCGALYVNWFMYGTSYVDEIPSNQLMIETLTLRGKKLFSSGKFIVKSVSASRLINIHMPDLYEGYTPYYPSGEVAKQWKADERNGEILRINHYWSRDRKYYDEVKSKRGSISFHAQNERYLKLFISDFFNKVEDTEILRFVPYLKKEVLKKKKVK